MAFNTIPSFKIPSEGESETILSMAIPSSSKKLGIPADIRETSTIAINARVIFAIEPAA